jgi:hypothetical protein
MMRPMTSIQPQKEASPTAEETAVRTEAYGPLARPLPLAVCKGCQSWGQQLVGVGAAGTAGTASGRRPGRPGTGAPR